MKKRPIGIFSVIVLAVLLGGLVGFNVVQASAQSAAVDSWVYPNVSMPSSNQSNVAYIGEYLSLTVILGTHDLFANQTLVHEGWVPDCQSFCFGGIKYAEDPTVHLSNEAMDCIGFKVHGTAEGTTCGFKQNATYTMVSASSGHSPAFTDTSCAATVAVTDGFSIAAGTYVAGTPSSGSVTDTVSHTWTGATGATTGLDLSCISWTTGNGANTLYASGQIGTTTVNIGDTLETIFSFTYASS